MDRFLQSMGPKNRNKAPLKTIKLATSGSDKMAVAPPDSPGKSLPTSQTEVEASTELASDDFSIDYKRLAIEVAMHISPDIQETLADTVTNMFHKIQADIAQHDQRIEDLESRLQSWESSTEEMQTHIQTLLCDNKRLSEKIDDLENRSRRNNLRILGLPEDIPQHELVTICEKELPETLGLPNICKVERAHRLDPDLRTAKRDQNPNIPRSTANHR